MRKYIRLSPDVIIIDEEVIAIVKNREDVPTKEGIVEQINIWIYLKNSQIPIVVSTRDQEEANEIEKKLLGE